MEIKVEITSTVIHIIDSDFYPKGSSPEKCLKIYLSKCKHDPGVLPMYEPKNLRGRIIDVIA